MKAWLAAWLPEYIRNTSEKSEGQYHTRIAPEYCYFRLNQDTAIMAPSFHALSDHGYDNFENEDNVDVSDLEGQHDVHMEEGVEIR